MYFLSTKVLRSLSIGINFVRWKVLTSFVLRFFRHISLFLIVIFAILQHSNLYAGSTCYRRANILFFQNKKFTKIWHENNKTCRINTHILGEETEISEDDEQFKSKGNNYYQFQSITPNTCISFCEKKYRLHSQMGVNNHPCLLYKYLGVFRI